MNTIKVKLMYPFGFDLDTKEVELNELELNALLNSKKVGSENKYFLVDELIFEDYKDDEGKFSLTVMLKSSN